ncbi:M13-type metalloendopeptidase [Arenimonas sp.]|uniref:M13-type metalloendopeptidase n=1 Tax=Arenimonas sp. TaxID=1872635 RepID=UPI0039E424FA
MSLNLRPLFAILVLTLASGSVDAAKKPATPAPPTPCTDFYSSVNGEWLKGNPLPANAASYSRWNQLNELADRQTRQLLADGNAQNARGPASRLLADLVASGLDEDSLDISSRAAIEPLLARIATIKKGKDVSATVAALYQAGVPVLFQFKVQRDPGTGRPRAVLVPDALGLGDPTFYLSSDPAIQEIGGIYRAYSADLLRYSGVPGKQLAAQSAAALSIEDALAKAMFGGETSVELMQADKSFPNTQLGAFVRQTGAAPEQVVLANGEFFKTLEKMLAKPAIPQWQAYLRMRVLQSMAPMLGKDYRLAYANLVDQTIAKRLPRTQGERVAALVQEQASDLLSAAYAERQMSDGEVRSAEAIGDALRAAMGRAIDRAPQLDAERKAAAHRQLAALRLAIGRPLQPTTIFDGLTFGRNTYATNVLALRRWAKTREIALLVAPDWPSPVSQTQPLIGFEASQNRVIVTAAALQSPVFGRVNPAADYGALGALIGREISLGYDSLLAGTKLQALAAQYGAYPVATGVNINPALTQLQNSADLAGLELAWAALNAQGTPPDWAAKKSFLTAWAALWARHDRENLASSMQSPYAPAQWRVNGSVVNLPDFAKVFSCKAKQPMFKSAAQQVALWR